MQSFLLKPEAYKRRNFPINVFKIDKNDVTRMVPIVQRERMILCGITILVRQLFA